jgi:acyl carrier protein
VTPEDAEAVIVQVILQIADERGIEIAQIDSNTLLVGPEACLDSVGLVSVVMEIEARLDEDFGVEVSLTSDAAMSRERSPLRTVGTIRDYVIEQVATPSGG